MCFIGVSWGGDACMVDSKDDKVIRIRPARFYDQFTGKRSSPGSCMPAARASIPATRLPPPHLPLLQEAHLLPARIRYPMKRVDFDPSGAPGSTGPGGRYIQNRGTSKYVRISWDEALDIVTSEMNRMKDTYGPTAILYQSDQHGENKTVHGPHGCGRRAARSARWLHPPGPQRRLLGRLVLGRQARLGM